MKAAEKEKLTNEAAKLEAEKIISSNITETE